MPSWCGYPGTIATALNSRMKRSRHTLMSRISPIVCIVACGSAVMPTSIPTRTYHSLASTLCCREWLTSPLFLCAALYHYFKIPPQSNAMARCMYGNKRFSSHPNCLPFFTNLSPANRWRRYYIAVTANSWLSLNRTHRTNKWLACRPHRPINAMR